MSRTGHIVLALVVGFLAAGAVIFAASTNGDDGDGDRGDEPVVLGSVDVFAYCLDTYGTTSQALIVGVTAFGWRCSNRSSTPFQFEEVDFIALCASTYGGEVDARPTDPDDPYSWECIRP